MSEDKVETSADEHLHAEVERSETVSSSTTPWAIRLIFGIGGIVLLASAFAVWQFRDLFNGQISEALPYIIAGLAVFGVGAIVESITTEIWLTIIGGIVALAITFLIVGRTAVYPSGGSSLYVIDRFSGAVEYCMPEGCKQLAHGVTLPKAPALPTSGHVTAAAPSAAVKAVVKSPETRPDKK